ncbi:unnamed protein product [Leuciscus chuanchicus]
MPLLALHCLFAFHRFLLMLCHRNGASSWYAEGNCGIPLTQQTRDGQSQDWSSAGDLTRPGFLLIQS